MTTPPPFLRGVNLGGWLVLEKWMTPSLFSGTNAVDEFTFMQAVGAAEKIETHRREFVTEEDFKWLAKNKINAVRIPVGYWILDGDDPYVGGIQYLDWAVKTAEKYNIYVLIDLHGAKGSQNGHDNSGRIGPSEWFKISSYRVQTTEVLEKLAGRYKSDLNVWGIELLNEPKVGLLQLKLRKFYKEAYIRLSKVARPGMHIIFHDAFTPRLMSGAIRSKTRYPVVMDIHWYQFTVLFNSLYSLKGYFKKIQRRSKLLRRLQKIQPVIIGEWSVVLSGKILNGRTKTQETTAFKEHANLQLEAYQYAAGWFYWTYKTEARGIWHFRSLVEDGLITLE
jgi:glucan 1,3-beta-glucosidase